MDEPVRVGLVGAGPWAQMVHAPALAAGPATTLVGVWARRPDAAADLAAEHGAMGFENYDDLVAACEAVAFSVPPDVQVPLAITAARAGRALLLEKPLGLDLDGAQRLADAVADAGVVSQVVLTWRYSSAVRSFLDKVRGLDALGGRGHFLTGGFRGGPFATPWRVEHGPLLDLGPHVVDVLDAALGDVVRVRAHGDAKRWVGLMLEHNGGAVSEVSLTGWSAVEPMSAGVEVHASDAVHTLDCAAAIEPSTFVTMVSEFGHAVRSGTPHPIDAAHALRIQRVLDQALRDLAA